jgi:hypothetical protein
VRGILASARWRRRFVWAGAALAVAGGVAAVIVVTWTGGTDTALTEGPGTTPAREPDAVEFQGGRRSDALTVAATFVRTAVARRHVEESWELVAPSLRDGYTRSSWQKGDIPVVPYPVAEARWKLAYSYPDEVGLQVALFPRKNADVEPAVFELGLRRFRRAGARRWLVESFTPSAVPTGTRREPPRGFLGLPQIEREPGGKGAASSTWLVIPFVVLGILVAAAVAVGVRGWLRGRRAVRLYERQTSTTRPS